MQPKDYAIVIEAGATVPHDWTPKRSPRGVIISWTLPNGTTIRPVLAFEEARPDGSTRDIPTYAELETLGMTYEYFDSAILDEY